MFGRFATRKHEAQYPRFFEGLVGAWCPSVTGPTGLSLYDLAGTRNGTLTNMDAPTDWVRDNGQYALDFDGSNDTVSHSNLAMTGAFSASLWFNKRSNGTYNGRTLWGNVNDNDTYLGIVTPTTIDTQSDTTGQVKNFTFSVSNNQWYNLVVNRDGSNGVRLYLNGVESTSGVQTVTGTYTLNRIGQYSNNAGGNVGFMWDGFLDDLQIRSRVLTTGEIQQLYRLGRGGMFRARRDIMFGSTANRRRRLLTGMV